MGRSSKSSSAPQGRSNASSSYHPSSTSYGASQHSSTSSQAPNGYYSQSTTPSYGSGRQASHDPYSGAASSYGQQASHDAYAHHSSASSGGSHSSQASAAGSYSSNYQPRTYDDNMSPAARKAYAQNLPGLSMSTALPPRRNHAGVIGAVQDLSHSQGYPAESQYPQDLDLGDSSGSRRGSSSRQDTKTRSSR